MSMHTPDDEPRNSPLPSDNPTASADSDVRSALDRALAADQADAERLTGILPVHDENDDADTFDPGPVSGNQHDPEEVGPLTDEATSYHPTTDANDPAAQGPTNSI